jgi:hypothetical protein
LLNDQAILREAVGVGTWTTSHIYCGATKIQRIKNAPRWWSEYVGLVKVAAREPNGSSPDLRIGVPVPETKPRDRPLGYMCRTSQSLSQSGS